MRLMAAAPVSNAQNSAANAPVVVSNSASASRNSTAVVAAPAIAFGSRSAASSDTANADADGRCAFHQRVASSEPHIATFITIGCSALALKSPWRYASTACSLLTSSSLNPVAPSANSRSSSAADTVSASATAREHSTVAATDRREENASVRPPEPTSAEFDSIIVEQRGGANDVPRSAATAEVRFARQRSECLPRDPLAQQRIDDDVSRAVARYDSVADQCGERGLYGRGTAETVPRACVRGQDAAPVFDDDRAQDGALRQRQALPDGFEQRGLLGEEARQGFVKVVERHLFLAAGADIVPRLVREALNVVGQVACELDNRRAESGLG